MYITISIYYNWKNSISGLSHTKKFLLNPNLWYGYTRNSSVRLSPLVTLAPSRELWSQFRTDESSKRLPFPATQHFYFDRYDLNLIPSISQYDESHCFASVKKYTVPIMRFLKPIGFIGSMLWHGSAISFMCSRSHLIPYISMEEGRSVMGTRKFFTPIKNK